MSINFEHAFIVHSKNEEAKWDEGHLFDFKLYVKDTNNLKELDATAYELTQDNQEYLFIFKDEVKLGEVKHKGKELWKHDSDKHGDKYPKLLKYVPDKLALSFDDTFVVYTKNVDGKLGNESCFDFKLFSMESNNLKEMGVTAYDLINQDNEHVFKFKDEHKCAMVKHKVDELWKHDNSKIDGKYPKLLKYVSDKMALIFDDSFVVYTKGDDGKLKNEHLFDFKLYSKSSDNNIEEIALTTFDITDQDNAILFNFKDVKIVKVTHKGKELWKHDSNNHGDKYPLKLSYNKDGSKILINFEGFFASCIKDGDGYKVIEFFELDILSTSSTSYFQCDSQNFEITFTIKTGMICGLVKIGNKKIYEPDYPEDVVSKIVLYKNLQQENSYFDVYLLNENLKRFEKKENSDEWHRKFNPLNLDIKRNENSLYFEYTTEDNGFTYTAKHNVGFIKVITGKKKVWESKGANEYGLKVKVSGSEDTPEVKILMYNGEEKVFNVTDDQSTT
nr:hypothetical protein MACL_00003491 [Theileria orientalis]